MLLQRNAAIRFNRQEVETALACARLASSQKFFAGAKGAGQTSTLRACPLFMYEQD
jgi:hypothetical protein